MFGDDFKKLTDDYRKKFARLEAARKRNSEAMYELQQSKNELSQAEFEAGASQYEIYQNLGFHPKFKLG